jgi:hypothetical protein
MSRIPHCRGCGVVGGWICPACEIIEKDTKSKHSTFRKEGMINNERAGFIRGRELPMSAAKGRYD